MKRTIRAFVAAFGMIALAGCTAKPLYAPASDYTGTVGSTTLSSIAFEAADDRDTQLVRNALLKRMIPSGQPVYSAALSVSTTSTGLFRTNVEDGDGETSAHRVSMTASAQIRDDATSELIGSVNASAFATYDQTTQEFANLRAAKEAKERAADQVARQLQARILALLNH